MTKVDPDAGMRGGFGRSRLLVWFCLAAVASAVGILHLAPALNFGPIAGLLPSYQLENAKIAFAEGGNRVNPALGSATRDIAFATPLEPAPLYYHAVQQEGRVSDREILALLDEVIRRDPRHYYARMWRARIYYRTGRMAEAVEEVLKVIPLNNSNEPDYIEALVDIARDPKNQPLMLGLASQEPYWARAFVRRAASEIDDEAFSLALASRSRTSLQEYIRGLIQGGQYDRAFLVWQSTLTEAELLNMRWPTDPRFERIGDASPFGWQSNSTITSQNGDGLNVFYNGRAAKSVVSQPMLLGVGYRYRFSAMLSGEMKERGGWFRWRLVCVQSRAVLMEVDVHSAGPEVGSANAEFDVPEVECGAQTIELSAQPGEYPFQARLQVKEVSIDEVGPFADAADVVAQDVSVPQ